MKPIDYKKIGERYTLEEYNALSEKLTSNCKDISIRAILFAYVFKNRIKKQEGKEDTEEILTKFFFESHKDVFKILYRTPLNMLPLYISDDSVDGVIAKWRLGVGK